MAALFYYSFKVSVCLSSIYIFYFLFLRNLTFYNWNRWYFLVGTGLALLIPLVDVSSLFQTPETTTWKLVQTVPKLVLVDNPINSIQPVVTQTFWTYQQILFWLYVAGMVIMLFKLIIPFISFSRLRRSAQLVSDVGIKIYQVDKNIIPFSLGRSIYVNRHLHSEADLEKIMQHELVHIQQRHSLDIIWIELLGVLNWFNPFAWLLRHSLRQNLEFIADRQVIQSGVDKRYYQYLLLKVIGTPAFQVANQFNFSSLKKRITMLNKMPSNRIHLMKFLFVLPIIAVLLLACQGSDEINGTVAEEPDFITVTGLVINANTYQPLSRAHLKDENSKTESFTDNRGLFTIRIPVSKLPVKTLLQIKKAGFADMQTVLEFSKPVSATQRVLKIEFIGLEASQKNGRPNEAFVARPFISTSAVITNVEEIAATPIYKIVQDLFEIIKTQQQDQVDYFH